MRAAVESHLERVFARGDDDRSLDASPAEAGALADGELAAYLRVRESVVASLVDEVAAAVQGAGTSLAFCDLSGAAKGYAAGTPNGEPAAAVAWRFGLDLRAIAAACDEISVCGYAADPKRVRTDLEAYVERLGPAPRLALTLRPMSPDCGSSENLRAKLRIARELGVTRAEFYHYGLAPLTALDTIRAAL